LQWTKVDAEFSSSIIFEDRVVVAIYIEWYLLYSEYLQYCLMLALFLLLWNDNC